ncbi:uncharacterized protein [Procambarus clarkii]|uniref:uncharacterized protein n=1 Tax=Procambarus clarkii TaxID=6728 RepID=UPI00374328A6
MKLKLELAKIEREQQREAAAIRNEVKEREVALKEREAALRKEEQEREIAILRERPSLTQKLYDILLKFRLKYAYTAEISKAFLRVGLQEEDRDFAKFLWVKNPEDLNSPIVTYRFSSVLFGTTSSPFLLQATLDIHLQKSSSPYKAEISQNLYTDNFQETVKSTTKLLQIYQEANKELQGANMSQYCNNE